VQVTWVSDKHLNIQRDRENWQNIIISAARCSRRYGYKFHHNFTTLLSTLLYCRRLTHTLVTVVYLSLSSTLKYMTSTCVSGFKFVILVQRIATQFTDSTRLNITVEWKTLLLFKWSSEFKSQPGDWLT
jgi:hypothetical protein